MYFDDRLETVLRLPDSGDGLARIQFRQLVDILGRLPADADTAAVEAAFARIEWLSARIPAADRARLLRQPLQPLNNPRLLSLLTQAEPDVASAAIGSAALDDAQWLTLIPQLPVRARGILRHRRGLSPAVENLLERLGVHDRGLPPAVTEEYGEASAVPSSSDEYISGDVLELLDLADDPPPPTSLSEWAQARAARDLPLTSANAPSPPLASPRANSADAGIGAIVRRIEEFRKARGTQLSFDSEADAPRLPLGDAAFGIVKLAEAIDFTTDQSGRIDWAEGQYAPAVVGFDLARLHQHTASSPALSAIMRRHLPFFAAHLRIDGAPAVEGEWQADGVPSFDPASGRFAGYCGRLRRRPADTALDPAAKRRREAERMREILHELRTPANAIQVAAEIIQQQLYGPAPHEYRALAAAIASDCAHILAGFEELDRLVKLETGALEIEPGECDLVTVLTETVARMRSWTEPRRSGFTPAADTAPDMLLVPIEHDEAERLIWRLFAALAGATAADETLNLNWWVDDGQVFVCVTLPNAFAALADEVLFGNHGGERGQPLSAGMFGTGFTLRLAAAEAAAAGGSLRREANMLCLQLPGLTPDETNNSNMASPSH